MTEQEHQHTVTLTESETVAPSTNKKALGENGLLAASVLLGAIIIGGSICYGLNMLHQDLLSQATASHQDLLALQNSVGQINISGGNGQQQAAAAAPSSGPIKVADRSNEPVLGNANAKVTMVEFGDFQCPYCKAYFQQTFNDIKTKYVDTGKVKIIFRHFPLTQIHVNAQIASVAAECANLQGKFWPYHDILYTDGQSDGTGLDKASLEKYADSLGLNSGTLGFGKNKFNQCLESNATLKTVQADQAEGLKDGVNGTPSFFINGKLVVGALPTPQFEQALDAALKE